MPLILLGLVVLLIMPIVQAIANLPLTLFGLLQLPSWLLLGALLMMFAWLMGE
jgi:hypothetical protein